MQGGTDADLVKVVISQGQIV